jgi:hypothetical protein
VLIIKFLCDFIWFVISSKFYNYFYWSLHDKYIFPFIVEYSHFQEVRKSLVDIPNFWFQRKEHESRNSVVYGISCCFVKPWPIHCIIFPWFIQWLRALEGSLLGKHVHFLSLQLLQDTQVHFFHLISTWGGNELVWKFGKWVVKRIPTFFLTFKFNLLTRLTNDRLSFIRTNKHT